MQRKFVRTPAAAEYCDLSTRTLEKLRLTGGGPPYSKPPGRRFVVYAVDDLDAWLRSGRRVSTSDPATNTTA
jgi:hypothetical protein